MTTLSCSGWFDPGDYPQPDSGGNRAPVIGQVGTSVAVEGQLLTISLNAYDPDGDPISFSASPLPLNAEIDRITGAFTWTPPLGASDDSPYTIEFRAFDGEAVGLSQGVITVEPAELAIAVVRPERIPQSGGVVMTIRGLGFNGPALVRVAEVAASDVDVVDQRTIEATSPPLPNEYGPEIVSVTIGDGRSTLLLNAVFVYRDQADLRAAIHRFALASAPNAWAAADLDGDGTDELVVASSTGVVAYDFAGSTTEDPTVQVLLGGNAVELIVAEMDLAVGDDLAVRLADGSVSALLSAHEHEPLELHAATNPALAITDLDLEGDGDSEVIVVDDVGDIVLYPAISEGRFGNPVHSSGALLPSRLLSAELTGDGVQDLLFVSDDGFALSTGIETGAFAVAELVEESLGYVDPVPQWDEATETWQVAALGDSSVGFFERLSSGRWQVARELEVADPIGSSMLLDVVDDAALELLSFDETYPAVRVADVDGGVFETAVWLMLGSSEGLPELADLNGDGFDDLVVLGADSDSAIWVEGREAGGLAAARGLFSAGASGVQVGDYMQDGRADVVVTNTLVGDLPAHLLFRVERVGRFTSRPVALPAVRDAEMVVLSDVTGNGWPDIVSLSEDGRIYCSPALGSGAFAPLVVTDLTDPPAAIFALARFGEVNDLIALNNDGQLLVLHTDEQCQFVVIEEIGGDDPSAAVALANTEDLDGDGSSEILAVTAANNLVVLSAPVDAPFEQQVEISLDVNGIRAISSGDINGDGDRELIIGGTDGVHVITGPLGEQTDEFLVTLVTSESAEELATGDLNGNGTDEIVATGGGQPPRAYWIESEGVTRHLFGDWHDNAFSPVIADVDSDADLDLITVEPGFGAVIWPNGAAP